MVSAHAKEIRTFTILRRKMILRSIKRHCPPPKNEKNPPPLRGKLRSPIFPDAAGIFGLSLQPARALGLALDAEAVHSLDRVRRRM